MTMSYLFYFQTALTSLENNISHLFKFLEWPTLVDTDIEVALIIILVSHEQTNYCTQHKQKQCETL